MSDQTMFEARLADAYERYLDGAPVDVDPAELTRMVASAPTHRGSRFGALGTSIRFSARLALVAMLLGALIIAALFAAGGQRRDSIVDATPSESPTAAEPTPSDGPALDPALAGTWIADKPEDLSFGEPSGPERLALSFEGNLTSIFVTLASNPQRERLIAFATPAADGIRLEARSTSDPVSFAGVELPGCPSGDAGTYRTTRSADGLLLTLSVVSDGCASRVAVLARTWVRSLGRPTSGGLGVVDAFDPLFTVKLPTGSYSIDRTPGSMTIVQEIPEFQFLAFKDPQGFLDPCDASKGRYEIAPGADAFVAYFRQLDGFTVESTTELRVDGHRAVRLVVQADLDATCPSGRRIQWQPKEESSDRSWFLRPGDVDSLIIVELPASTVMFEVLPAPHDLEDEVIGSIRLLDRLPTTP